MPDIVIFMGGTLNIADPIFHWQLYIWSWIFAGLIMVGIHIAYYFGPWDTYKPLHGLYYAFKAGSHAAFTCNSEMYFDLISERDAKCVFNYANWNYELPPSRIPDAIRRLFFNYASAFDIEGMSPLITLWWKFGHVNKDVEIAKKLQNYEWERSPSVTIGGVPTDIILDADRWTIKDSPQHKAIREFSTEWNERNPEDQIHSFSKFQRLISEGLIDAKQIPGIQPELVVPWVRIDASFPMEHQDNEYDGYRRQNAEEEMAKARDEMKNLGIKILMVSGLLGGIFYVLRFASFAMALPH